MLNQVKQMHGLSRSQVALVVIALLLGFALAGYGAAGSYETIRELADQRGLPLAGLVPVGVDGGLVGVVVLDLLLAWTAQSLGWLRQLSRLLTAGTVAANAVAGWPDLISVGLHVAAPVMLLAMVEAGRGVLLRRLGRVETRSSDPIPAIRWLLSPWRTWLLWRRMTLWQVTSYHSALEVELRLRRAVARLRARYGRGWARRVPSDLVWMLRGGVFLEEACAIVGTLVSSPAAGTSGGDEAAAGPAVEDRQRPSQPVDMDVDEKLLEEVAVLNQRHWTQYARPVSAETVRRHLGIGSERARVLTRRVRAADRRAVNTMRIVPASRQP